MDQAGGSIIKVQAAHVVISIARSLEDIDNSRATLALLKNRSGKSGIVLHNIRFDNGTSTISCDEVEEFDNSERKWSIEAERLAEQNYKNTVADINSRAYGSVNKPSTPQYVDKATGEVFTGQVVSSENEGNVVGFIQ